MLKEDVIEYVGYEGAYKKLAQLLDITEAAVSMWDRLVPRRRAEKLHDIFRSTEFIVKFPLVDADAPTYDAAVYNQAVIDLKGKRELDKFRELNEKHGDSESIKYYAFDTLKRSDRAKTESKKVAILTRFIKGLI